MTGHYPRISRGLGKLTPELWGRIMDAVQFVEQQGPRLQRQRRDNRGGQQARPSQQVRLYRVTDAVSIGLYRWEYGWDRAIISGTSFVPQPDSPTHETDGFGRALNAEEANNDSQESGYGVPVSSPLASLIPQPLAPGSVVPGILLLDETADPQVRRPVLMPATNPLAVACST